MVPNSNIANIISSLEDLMNNKITKGLGITNEAKKLVNRLEKVLDVLEDAERKKIGDGDVKQWVAELQEVVFESEKVIDYCRIEAHKIRSREKQTLQQVAVRPRLLASCFNKSGLQDEISRCMRTLNLKMKAILKKKSQLNLQQLIISNTCRATLTQNSYQSLSSNTCVGATIETDTKYLVNLLTKEETDEEEEGSHHLMATVGVGGIGKTTLARKIFNDKRIRGTFDLRIWISLYPSLKDTTLLANIIDAAGGTPGKSRTRARLEPKLATTINRKRFLIVLDDVSDGRVWENLLKAPLQTGARGSRILITTRDKNVAMDMGATHVHDVKKLSPEEGWLLLRESSSLEVEDESEILIEIGLKISERCAGLPSAIKTVGGILKSKEPTIKNWRSVYESQTWSIKGLPYGLPHALYFGYADLPLNLKQCFLYCTLFPRDFCVNWQDLIKQWVAENFLVKRDGSILEEIGEEHYKKLVERYLISAEPSFDDTEKCKMHDCLVNTARLLSADEISIDEINKLGEITFRPFHISLVSNGLKKVPEEVKTKEKLRTLILSKNEIKDDGLRDVFARLRMLRVLDISETLVEEIPSTLRNLLHLRYLNLSRTKIKELPESIEHLPFLQYLILQECKRLRSLPKGIEQLKSLRNLDLMGTMINRFFFRIGKLVNLNSLDFFNVNNELEQQEEKKGWFMGELKNLNKLRSLCILQIDKTRDLDDAKEALLGTKQCLKELELNCSNEATPSENPIIIHKIEGIIDELCPPPCLKTLKIMNYFGNKYPSWLFIDLLSNLQHLELINCQFCQTQPPLGQLPQLQFLYIANAYFRDIGADMIGIGQEVSFPKLEKLHFQSLHKLESWTGFERPGIMPCLKAFQLESCSEIKFLPSCMKHLTRLKELRIIECKSLELIRNLARLKELSVWNAPNLRKISNLTSLEELSISHSPNLQIIKNVNSLKSVQIFDYDLEAIPRWLKTHAIHIQSLDLAGKVEMLERCLINGPDWDIIQDIAHVYGHSINPTYFLYNRSPFSFETNLSARVSQQGNSLITETVSIETIVEENEESFSKEESLIVDTDFTVAVNKRSHDSSSLRSVHDELPTVSIQPSSLPITTIRDDIFVNMSENICGLSNSDTDTTGTGNGSLVKSRRKKNNITEVVPIAADKNAKITDSMPSNLVFNFDFSMPSDTSATEETLISKLETKLSHKEENLIIDEIITGSHTTKLIEPSSLMSLHDNFPTISINPISSPPTTTIRDSILVNMSENTSGLTISDNDSLDQSASSLVKRRRRKNNIAEVVSIDDDKNANTRDSMPKFPPNLVPNFDFGMPINASATEERLISKLGTALSHKNSESNLNQNASDLLYSDIISLGNVNLLSSKTKTIGHQTIEKHTIEKSRDFSSSNLLYGDPNVFTNEEELVERIGTLNHHNSEKQANDNTSLNLNFSSNLEAVPTQIQRLGNFGSTWEPVTHKDKVEGANQVFAMIKKAMNVAFDQVKGIHQSRKIDQDNSVKQPTRNASFPRDVVAGSSTSGIVSTPKAEVNDKLQKKERLKDHLIMILLAVTVMQLFLIFWLI